MSAKSDRAIFVGAMLLWIAFAFTSVRSQTPGSAQQPDTIIEHELAEARLLYNHAEYVLAEKLYAQILAFDPVNPRATEGRKLLILTRGTSQSLFAPTLDYPTKPTPYEATMEPWESDKPTVAMALKSVKIILPQLSFNGVTLSEALETIRSESRRLDPDPRPEARGVPIRRQPSAMLNEYEVPAEFAVQSETRIYLHLRNATLDEALEFVGQQAGLRTSYHQDGISLIQIRGKVGAEFRQSQFRPWPELAAALNDAVDPKDFSGIFSIGSEVKIPRVDARRFLASKGVFFPPGATADYFPSRRGGQIFVCDTPENLEKMEKLVEQSDNGPVPLPTPDHP